MEMLCHLQSPFWIFSICTSFGMLGRRGSKGAMVRLIVGRSLEAFIGHSFRYTDETGITIPPMYLIPQIISDLSRQPAFSSQRMALLA
jgi:hypothetical protein